MRDVDTDRIRLFSYSVMRLVGDAAMRLGVFNVLKIVSIRPDLNPSSCT